jgi:hypothetical protein
VLVNTLTGFVLDSVLTRLLPAGLVPNTNIATGVCVLVGTFDWGPVGVSTPVGNLNNLVASFGNYNRDVSLTNETTGYAQAWGYFTGGKKRRIAGGGIDLRVIRVAGAGKAYASGTIVDAAAATVGTVRALYYGFAGNNIQRIVANGDNRLAVPTAPVNAPSAAGGTLATGNVDVVVTFSNAQGETLGSPITTTAVVGATGSISVAQPAPPTGATFWSVYAGVSGGTVYRSGAAIAIGTVAYVITVLPANTQPVLPTVNTAVTSFHLTVVPFDTTPNEVFKNLTPTTAAGAINGISKYIFYTPGASTLLPVAGTAFIAGGDSGLTTVDADYVGTPGINPTGFELAKTVTDANFLVCGKMSAAIKAQMKAVADILYCQAIIGPNDATVTPAAAITEQTFNDQGVIYLYGLQNWLNPVSGLTVGILPAGSVAGALCNGPYWVNLSQTQLNGYLGPVNPLADADANLLAQAGIVPITGGGSTCRKGVNTSNDPSVNQIEDFRIPVFIAKSADATVAPLIAEPQVVNPLTFQSDFFDDIREALEGLLRTQPREAIQQAYVIAAYDATLAQQNKARVQVVVRQTGKANQIIVDVTSGRSVMGTVPAGVTLVTGS